MRTLRMCKHITRICTHSTGMCTHRTCIKLRIILLKKRKKVERLNYITLILDSLEPILWGVALAHKIPTNMIKGVAYSSQISPNFVNLSVFGFCHTIHVLIVYYACAKGVNQSLTESCKFCVLK